MVTRDAVLTINPRAFFSAKLGEAQASAFAEAPQLALAAVDPVLLAQLRGWGCGSMVRGFRLAPPECHLALADWMSVFFI